MAILGFPSTAIIGDLDWTGVDASIQATNGVVVSGSTSVQIASAGVAGFGNSYIAINSNGISISTDDDSSLIEMQTNAGGVSVASNGPVYVASNYGNTGIFATETLSLTGGNLISGGVSITTPQILHLGGDTSVDIQSQQGVYLTAPSVDGTLGVNLGSGIAELHVDDGASYVRVISDGEGVEIKGAGFLFVNAPLFQHNGANVATQSFSIAMAIALG